MKRITLVLVLVAAVLASSCSSIKSVGNGAFSDVSLNRNSNEYELKRLNEINVTGKALFGIPMKTEKKQGTIVRFNGMELGKTQQILPILTMIGYTFGVGVLVQEIGGYKNDDWGYNDEYRLNLPVSMAIALPFAAAINNQMWQGAAVQNASWNLNSRLVNENPNVDVFLNPKYEITTQQGLFTQKATIKAKVMGATIKVD